MRRVYSKKKDRRCGVDCFQSSVVEGARPKEVEIVRRLKLYGVIYRTKCPRCLLDARLRLFCLQAGVQQGSPGANGGIFLVEGFTFFHRTKGHIWNLKSEIWPEPNKPKKRKKCESIGRARGILAVLFIDHDHIFLIENSNQEPWDYIVNYFLRSGSDFSISSERSPDRRFCGYIHIYIYIYVCIYTSSSCSHRKHTQYISQPLFLDE